MNHIDFLIILIHALPPERFLWNEGETVAAVIEKPQD